MLNLGEKIKELRKRDGKKQDDLANALGVTAQAVSRWESNGCYPDMSLIPAIANYFHITIDALFGYNNDREVKIEGYTKKANRFFVENNVDKTETTEIIQLLRKGLEEFPAEPELQRLLALALFSKGKNEVAKPNIYLEEAAALYEELLKRKSDIILPLLFTYISMGEYDKAEKKAMEQPKIEMSREVLLASIFNDRKGAQYHGEAVLSLLHQLGFIISQAITQNEKLSNSKEGIEIILAVRNLYNKIIGDECVGKFHSDLCMLDLACVNIAVQIKDYDQVLTFFDSAYMHYIEHSKSLMNEINHGCKDEHFKSPLLSEVGNTTIPIVVCRSEYLKDSVSSLPVEIKTQIINNPKYTGLFNT